VLDLAKRLIIGSRWEGPIRRGHSFLTGSKNSRYDYETIEIMRRVLRPASVGVDVGAFQGGMLRHMRRFAPMARHFAFEPIPRLADELRRRFPDCRVVPAAVGEREGVATYREVVRSPALSGLRRRIDLPADAATREYEVPVETLDHVIPPDAVIALVKIDVEGGELGVFRGARETLRRCRPVVVFECGLGGADSYGTRPGELHGFVAKELGLRIFLLQAWLDGGAPLSEDEFVTQFDQSLNYYFVAAS
jgi:FkbM family methyltransferase